MANRLTSKPPTLFRWIQAIGGTATSIGTAILSANVSMPEALVNIAGYLVAGGLVAIAIAQLPNKVE